MRKILFALLSLYGYLFSIQTGYTLSYTTSSATGSIVTFQSGWNTFSTPKLLDNLTSQSGTTGIYFYALSSSGWSLITPTPTSIVPLNGYLVNNTNTGTTILNLKYKENVSPLEMLFQKQLNMGWNLIGISTITTPFSSLSGGDTMRVDFTTSSDGNLNLQNKVNSTFYNSLAIQPQLFESYALFLQNPLLYAGIQSGAGAGYGSQGELDFTASSGGIYLYSPGISNAVAYSGSIKTTTNTNSPQLSISYSGNTADMSLFQGDVLTVYLNGVNIGEIHTLTGNTILNLNNTFSAGANYTLQIRGSISNSASNGDYGNFIVSLNNLYDENGAPINLSDSITQIGNSLKIATAEMELKTATVAAPSTTRIYSSAEQEIGRFALTARNEVARVQSIVVNNIGTGAVTLQNIANSTSSAKLVDVATGLEVSATVTLSGDTLTFSSMNDTVGKDVTKNYKVLLGVTSIESYYTQNIQLAVLTGGLTVVRDSNSTSVNPTGTATTKAYTLGTVSPTVLVTTVNENVFKVRVTNPDTNTGITLTGVTFDFKTALPGNTTYTANAYLRDLGSTHTFGQSGVSTASGSVPSLDKNIAVTGLTTSMTANKNGGYIEFEVYFDSPNLLPTGGQLQVAVKRLFYSVGAFADTEIYVGTAGASATFTK